MKNFKRDDGRGRDRGAKRFGSRDSGHRGFGKRDGGRDFRRDSGHSAMFDAICDKCHKACQVPFQPSSGKPVYCSDCFRSSGAGENRRFNDRSDRRHSFGDKKMFDAICDKCGQACQIPFQPSSSKPIYCSNCFGKNDNRRDGGSKGGDTYQAQFDMLNRKLDQILRTLEHASGTNNTMPVEPKKITNKSAKKEVAQKKLKSKKKK